jgi:hypothetical protein
MRHDPSTLTEAAALAIIAKHKAKMAKRGIRYAGPASPSAAESGDNPFLVGPQTELDYRRMLKEMNED